MTIDEHLMTALKKMALEQGVPLKQIVNRALQVGLEHLLQPPSRRRYKGKTYAMGASPGIDLTKALEIASALEDEETARKLALRK